MKWYKKVVFQNYANFKERARRKEYWMFVLFNSIFAIIAMILDNVLGLTFFKYESCGFGYGPIYLIYILAVLIPSIAVAVRRLHDISKSGWMYLIILIPIVGIIWFIILAVKNSTPGENKYGPNPKGE